MSVEGQYCKGVHAKARRGQDCCWPGQGRHYSGWQFFGRAVGHLHGSAVTILSRQRKFESGPH